MVTLRTLIINAPADLHDVLDQTRGKVALIRHIAAFGPNQTLIVTRPCCDAVRHCGLSRQREIERYLNSHIAGPFCRSLHLQSEQCFCTVPDTRGGKLTFAT